jgi:hypothetical protein
VKLRDLAAEFRVSESMIRKIALRSLDKVARATKCDGWHPNLDRWETRPKAIAQLINGHQANTWFRPTRSIAVAIRPPYLGVKTHETTWKTKIVPLSLCPQAS